MYDNKHLQSNMTVPLMNALPQFAVQIELRNYSDQYYITNKCTKYIMNSLIGMR